MRMEGIRMPWQLLYGNLKKVNHAQTQREMIPRITKKAISRVTILKSVLLTLLQPYNIHLF